MIDSTVFIPQGNGTNRPINLADLALMAWTADEYDEQQGRYTSLRDWYNGVHNIPLTPRQQLYLERDSLFKFAVNYLRLPVELCVERLTVEGFDGPDGIGGEGGLIDEWWTSGRMDALQNQVHRAAIRDGDTYLLVEWDDENGRPVFSHEPAYDGTEGMKVHYLSNLKREMTMASKVWTESRFDDLGKIKTVRRLNLYQPDVIKKYEDLGKGWQPYKDNPGDPWPIPWPMGRIPVIHFRWKDDGGNWGESELYQLITLQELINKTSLDELEAADAAAFQRLIVSGMGPPSEAVSFAINSILFLNHTAAANVGVTIVPPGDLSQLRDQVSALIIRMAQISHIPLQYFQITGAIASADTQAADDTQLTAKVKSEAVAIGNAWEDAMYIALKLNELYGDGRDLARGENIECVWADFERVDPLALEERRAAIVRALVDAGLSVDGVLALPALGYTEEEQQRMMQGDVVTGIEQ
jgi:hypothetical protein